MGWGELLVLNVDLFACSQLVHGRREESLGDERRDYGGQDDGRDECRELRAVDDAVY